jgi:hypothetical protein
MNGGSVARSGEGALFVDPARTPSSGAHRGRRRHGIRRACLIGAAIAVSGLAVVAGLVAVRGQGAAPAVGCNFVSTATSAQYSITPTQAQNAAIIAAVAMRKGMPDHAVTVALAASLQETQLRNLSYGDLDSVGLFQQRPSQGWGTSAQIMDPNYAASAFYDHLAQVPGWQTMAVTEAAQRVQQSATPDAYANWETEARSLATALTGEVPAGLSCRLDGFGGLAPPPSALAQAATTEMGAQLLGVPVSIKTGWRVATWAVAHAYNYHISSVSFESRMWTVASETWSPIAGSEPGTAQNTVNVT